MLQHGGVMKRVLLVPGDGIGPEVMAEAKRLLSAISQKCSWEISVDEADWGAERWLREGVGLPKGALESLPKTYDAILFGAVGDPRIPDTAHGREILLGLRFGLDLYINLRPIKLYYPPLSTLKSTSPVDIVIFRENTEDLYLGLGNTTQEGTVNEIAIDESKHTFRGVERIIRAAFDYAVTHDRARVTLVDKSNAVKFGGSLWQRVFKSIAKDYLDIKADHVFVDVAAMQMVQAPEKFDVIVTSNLFGDILSDLGAGIIGGLGLSASANINPGRIALFEPVHGSAPDLVGRKIANPFAMFMSVGMMMDHFGHHDIAAAIERAVVKAIETKNTTPDLAGTLSTTDAASYVINEFLKNA